MNLVSFRLWETFFSSTAFLFFFFFLRMTDISDSVIAHTAKHAHSLSLSLSLTHTHICTHCQTKKHNRGVQIFVRKLLEKDIATVPFGCPKPLSSETCHGSWQRLFVSAVPSFSPRLSISFSCFSNADGKLSRNATTEKTMYIYVCVCVCVCVSVRCVFCVFCAHLNIMAVPPVWQHQWWQSVLCAKTHTYTQTYTNINKRACIHKQRRESARAYAATGI